MYELPTHKNRKEIPEYLVWKGMRARCSTGCNSNHSYKEKNITVCERWNNFILFYNDMGPRPSSKHLIDRVNNNKGYSPDNCRWAIRKTQCENRGDFNKVFTHNGESKVLKAWAKDLNIDYSTLHKRISYQGLSFEEAISYKGRGIYKYENIDYTLDELSIKFNISKSNISSRLSKGWSLEKTLTTQEITRKI